MLTPARLQQIRFTNPEPGWQRTIARVLTLNYALAGVEVVIEGLDNLPQDRPVFIAMNHTDRYNCWPLQWKMHRLGLPRYTATWVKGKYFESPFVRAFMLGASNIPMPSRGYLITGTFQREVGHRADPQSYRQLRDLLDGQPAPAALTPDAARLIDRLGGADSFIAAMSTTFEAMMTEVMRMHREALGSGSRHLLVFPEGTRSKTLLRGHTGLAQVSQHLRLPIVPIGCSGSDVIYPADSPIARRGRVIYRIGAPLMPEGPLLDPHRIQADFVPLSQAASARYGQQFQAITDVVMAQISALVEPQYRARATAPSGDTDRFR